MLAGNTALAAAQCNGAGTTDPNLEKSFDFDDGTLQTWENIRTSSTGEVFDFAASKPPIITPLSESYVVADDPWSGSATLLAEWTFNSFDHNEDTSVHGQRVPDSSGAHHDAFVVINREFGDVIHWDFNDTVVHPGYSNCHFLDFPGGRIALREAEVTIRGVSAPPATARFQVQFSVGGRTGDIVDSMYLLAIDDLDTVTMTNSFEPFNADSLTLCADWNGVVVDKVVLHSAPPVQPTFVPGPLRYGGGTAFRVKGDGMAFSPEHFFADSKQGFSYAGQVTPSWINFAHGEQMTVEIQFPSKFQEVPAVDVVLHEDRARHYKALLVTAENVTTTGFTLQIEAVSDDQDSNNMYTVQMVIDWQASVLRSAGVRFKYFELRDKTYKLDEIDFTASPVTSGVVHNFDIGQGVYRTGGTLRDEFFAYEFVGDLLIPYNATYEFVLECDDGCMLYLDGNKIIDDDGLHPSREQVSRRIPLVAGTYVTLRVVYFEWSDDQELQVKWECFSPSHFTKVPIPDSALSHLQGATEINFAGSDSFTLEVVMKTTADGERAILSKTDDLFEGPNAGTYKKGWYWRIHDGVQSFMVGNGNTERVVHGTAAINDGEWHHLAVVRDTQDEELRIYVDHVLDAHSSDSTVNSGTLANNKDIRLGLFNTHNDQGYQAIADFALVRISLGPRAPSDFKQPVDNTGVSKAREHAPLVLTSLPFTLQPQFHLVGYLLGGNGDADAILNINELPDKSSENGFLGMVLYEHNTGKVVASKTRRKQSTREWDTVDFSALDLAESLDTTVEYQLALVDTYHAVSKQQTGEVLDWIAMDSVKLTGAVFCDCDDGYAGGSCQYSDVTTCAGHGTVRSDGSCLCNTGYIGDDCSITCPGFDGTDTSTLCSGHGTCGVDEAGQPACRCEPNWEGEGSSSLAHGCSECTDGLWGSTCSTVCPGRRDDVDCSGSGVCDQGKAGTGTCACAARRGGAGCENAVVKVNAPSTMEQGRSLYIRWNVAGDVDLVNVEIGKRAVDGNDWRPTLIYRGNTTDGFVWQVPRNMTVEADYVIRVSSVSDLSIYSESAALSITAVPLPAPRPRGPDSTSGWWIGVLVMVLVLAAIVVVACCVWRCRKTQITDCLLWKLSSRRFNPLTRPAQVQPDDEEDREEREEQEDVELRTDL